MLLLEEIANIWSLRLYSLLHFTNFTFFLPRVQYDGTSKDNNNPDGFASFMVFIIWAALYVAYKKFLNLLLRRMQFPLIQRNRIIDGLWCCAFASCSMIFLTYFVPAKSEHNCSWRKAGNFQLGSIIHKAFYLHRATIIVFVHNSWLKGWSSQLFASSIYPLMQQKWPVSLSALLFYKASDTALLNICKLLLTLSRSKIVKRIAKILFLLHFLNWIYIFLVLVPGSLITQMDVTRNFRMQPCLWMWLICEILNLVRNKEFACLYSKQSLETSLFPPLSQEAIELSNIIKKHRNSINANKITDGVKAQKHKTELWQTLFCAMTMKKKLKKLRDSKRITNQESSEN